MYTKEAGIDETGFLLSEKIRNYNKQSVKIDISSNDIIAIDLITPALTKIEEINLAYNVLTTLDNLTQFKALRYLDISNNQVLKQVKV